MRRLSLILSWLCLIIGTICVCYALLLQHTGPDAPGAEIAVFPLPGATVQIEAQPAQPGAAGYLEVWYLPADGSGERHLLRVYGQEALPAVAPPPAPAPTWSQL